MSYLHPAYYKLLPATARPQLIAYLQLVEMYVHKSADGWIEHKQSKLARDLGRSERSIQLYERVCLDAGILVVKHGQRHNRRSLTMRSAREALASNPKPSQAPIRECRNALRDSAATDCGTVENFRLLPRARVLSEDPSLTLRPPKPAAPAERASPVGKIPLPAQPSKPKPLKPSDALVKRLTAFCIPLGNRWAAQVAHLVFDLVRAQGERQALGYLDIVDARTSGTVDPYRRSKAVLAMLNARLRKAREQSARRTGAA